MGDAKDGIERHDPRRAPRLSGHRTAGAAVKIGDEVLETLGEHARRGVYVSAYRMDKDRFRQMVWQEDERLAFYYLAGLPGVLTVYGPLGSCVVQPL